MLFDKSGDSTQFGQVTGRAPPARGHLALDRHRRRYLRPDGNDQPALQAECVHTTVCYDGPFKTIADVDHATARWADGYNQRRLHGSLGAW
jgi:hypothetical protein